MTTAIRSALVVTLASLAAACASHPDSSARIGAAGGVLSTQSGITLTIPAGAFARETEVRVVEAAPRDGAMVRVSLEPSGLALAAPATVTFKVEDGNVRVSEIEHGASGEVRHGLEHRRHDARGEVEVQVEHLTEVEVEHGLSCSADCGAGFECDDGVCKAHQEDDPATHDAGDDKGVDLAGHEVGDDKGGTSTPPPADDKGNDGLGHG